MTDICRPAPARSSVPAEHTYVDVGCHRLRVARQRQRDRRCCSSWASAATSRCGSRCATPCPTAQLITLRHTGHGRLQHAAAADVDPAARRRGRPPPAPPSATTPSTCSASRGAASWPRQLAIAHRRRVRRLVLASTVAGATGWPARPSVLRHMMTPRRYYSRSYFEAVAPDHLRRAGPAGPELAPRRGPAPAGPATELARLLRAGARHLDVHAPLPLLHRDQGARPSS